MEICTDVVYHSLITCNFLKYMAEANYIEATEYNKYIKPLYIYDGNKYIIRYRKCSSKYKYNEEILKEYNNNICMEYSLDSYEYIYGCSPMLYIPYEYLNGPIYHIELYEIYSTSVFDVFTVYKSHLKHVFEYDYNKNILLKRKYNYPIITINFGHINAIIPTPTEKNKLSIFNTYYRKLVNNIEEFPVLYNINLFIYKMLILIVNNKRCRKKKMQTLPIELLDYIYNLY